MKKDILIVGQTPPPYHGQAMMTSQLFEHDWKDLKVRCLRMQYSESIENVGKISAGKVWELFRLVLATWRVAIFERPYILYYLPASPDRVPVFRDIIYLGLVRWMFQKTVFHYHAGGLDDFVDSQRLLGLVAKPVYAGADCSIDVNVTSPPSGEYFGAKENVVVMNGIDVDAATRQRGKSHCVRVVYLGLLSEDKGADQLIKTARLLKTQGCECEFVMVGAWVSELYQVEFESMLQAAGVKEMFVFKGVQRGVAKAQILADSDIFIFPTRHPTETFGLVLIEAMSFGLPIVASRWRGVGHVVADSGCAILCEPCSASEYAEAICELAGDEDKREAMGEAARICYRTRYTRSIFIERMEAIFNKVLNS